MVLDKIKLISIADILTICNGICGFLAIISFIKFYPNITIGTGLIFLGLVFDGMDGAAARKFGTKHDYGRHLDSISDSFTFCLAPATLVFVVFYAPINGKVLLSIQAFTEASNLLLFLACFFIIFFGLKRLIKFTTYGYRLKNFLGLATPAFAFMAIVLSHILDPHRPENNSIAIVYFSLIIVIVGAILMDAKIEYPKIRGKVGVLLALAIIVSLLSIEVQKWFRLGSSNEIFIYYRIISFFGLGLIIGYVFVSPLFIAFSKQENK